MIASPPAVVAVNRAKDGNNSKTAIRSATSAAAAGCPLGNSANPTKV